MRLAAVDGLTMTAKTGQSLIAHSIFDSLPETPSTDQAKGAESSGMDVDVSPGDAAASAADGAAASASGGAAGSKKFSPPLDGVTQDLIPEGVAYLRLLLIMMNLDAGKVKEVSKYPQTYPGFKLIDRLPTLRWRLLRFAERRIAGHWIRLLRRCTST